MNPSSVCMKPVPELCYAVLPSPIGPLRVWGRPGVLMAVEFPHADESSQADDCFHNRHLGPASAFPAATWKGGLGAIPANLLREDAEAMAPALSELTAYFEGRLRNFTLALDLRANPFQETVLRELARVPYGQTLSYGELAARIGRPGAARAVGMANARNPIPIVIPCHRVIGKRGDLVGFGGGIDAKRRLLDLERGVLAGSAAFP